MTNLDSMSLSKIPYGIRPKTGGYSHGVQLYNILDRNLKDILCFNKKKVNISYIRKNKLPSITYISIKNRYKFRSYLKYRKTSLTMQMISGTHIITHTVLSTKPYMSGRVASAKNKLNGYAYGAKNYATLRRVMSYRRLILSNCEKNFFNYIWKKESFYLWETTVLITVI